MFRSAVARLTIWYLVIIMLISLFFSVALYNVLSGELDRGLRRQQSFYQGTILRGFGYDHDSLEQSRVNELNEGRRRLIISLIGFNLLILLGAGGASYLLAKRTLWPIEETHQAQSRFTADASHELRTPLSSMKTEIEVALRQKVLPTSEAKGILKSNLEEIGKLEDLSNGLLTLSRLQDINEKNFFTPLSLKEIVNSSVKNMGGLAKQKHIKINPDITETELSGNQNSLQQLMRILFDNAIKYSPENTEIKITNFVSDNSVFIEIADQGFGIKEEDLPHIFDRFYRADLSRSKKEVSGYGLGLSIAKQIVEVHNGKIEVTSTSDRGSVFTVKLPLNQPGKLFSST